VHAARKLAAVILAVVAMSVFGSVAEAGRLVVERFASPTLGRPWDYLVYLPDDYESGRLRYPVLYLLHGYAQDHYEWVTKGKIHRVADTMIRAGEIPPCIIIMPAAGSSWYVDRQEKMETAFVNNLLPEMERRYRTIRDRFGRVIGGVSMGGYGALRFTLKSPELFAAAALLSPAIYTPDPPPTSSARWAPPFQTEGKFDPEVWRSLNYPTLLESFLAKNIVVPLHLDSGDHDEFQSEYHAAMLYKFWRDHGWPAEFRVIPGEHNFGVWRDTARVALQFIFETVRRPEPIDGDAVDAGP
jgi:S-formylglutathione hydrolase FrmB